MTTITRTHVEIDAVPPCRSVAPWLLAAFLFGVFFIATQDVNSPLIWLDQGEADISGWVDRVEGGQAGRQIGFLLLAAFGALGVILPARHGRPTRPSPTLLYLLVALVAWAYLSFLWSHDRPFTVKRLVVFTGLWLAAAAIAKHFRARDVILCVAVYGVASLVTGVYAESRVGLRFGESGYRWAGSMHPNHAGVTFGLLALSMAHFATTRRRPAASVACLAVAAVAMLVLLATRSRTALAATLAAGGVFTLLRLPPTRGVLLTSAMAAVVCLGTILFQSGLLGPVWEAALLGRDEADVRTLTGRTTIWAFAADELMQEPPRLFVGYGHDSFWNAAKSDAVSRLTGFTISEAHSAYFEILLNLGLVGLLLFLGCVLGAAIRWLAVGRTRLGRYPADAAFAVAAVCFTLVHGLVESTASHAQFSTLMLFALVARAALGPRPAAYDVQLHDTLDGGRR